MWNKKKKGKKRGLTSPCLVRNAPCWATSSVGWYGQEEEFQKLCEAVTGQSAYVMEHRGTRRDHARHGNEEFSNFVCGRYPSSRGAA